MTLLPTMEPTEKAEAVAVIASVFMAAGMISVAYLSGSVSVLAEGIDTCVDIITSIAVMIGLKLSKRRSTEFPYGLYKIENLVTIAIAALILFSAYALAREAIDNLVNAQETVSRPWVAMATMAVVAVVTGLLAWNKGRVGRQENSPSLLADSRHSWTDAIASAGVVLGLGLNAMGVPYVDSLMALVIAAILAWSGVQLLVSAVKVLLDASIEQEYLDVASTTALADPRVRRVVRVDGRNSGSYRFLQLTLIPQSDDLRDAETCAREVKAAVLAAVQNVESVEVEWVSEDSTATLAAVLLQADGDSIASGLGSAAAFALVTCDPQRPRSAPVLTRVDLSSGGPKTANEIASAVTIARHGANALLVTVEAPTGGAGDVLAANGIAVLCRPDLPTLHQAERAAGELDRDRAAAAVGNLAESHAPEPAAGNQ
jgi:cation diffusion facilitator family transporter